MTSQVLKGSARRVQDFLAQRGYAFQVLELPGSTRTASDAAQTIGCSVSQIAKSIVFVDLATGRPVLVVASGTNRVDTGKVELATGLRLGKADAAFVRDRVGYAIGGVPPVAHGEPIETILDTDLKRHETLWAAAGTPFSVFELSPEDLGAVTSGRWLEIA